MLVGVFMTSWSHVWQRISKSCQVITTCIIWYMLFMDTKMYRPLDILGNVDYTYVMRAWYNAIHWRWTTYLTIQSWSFSWGNIINISNSLSAILNTSIAIHIIIISIYTLQMTGIRRTPNRESKIILDIVVTVVHQGCPFHILFMSSIKRSYILETLILRTSLLSIFFLFFLSTVG